MTLPGCRLQYHPESWYYKYCSNLSHSKGSIIILRDFPLLFRKIIYFFSLLFLSKHQLLPTSWERQILTFYIITQQFPRPWHSCYDRLPELPQIIWIFLHPWTASPGSACLCKPAVQQPSLYLHFFLKKSRRFLLQYLVGNSKKRGTAAVFHRHKLRNPTCHRTSVFSSPDRKETKTSH